MSSLTWAVSTLGKPDATLAEWMALCARWQLDEIELRVLDGTLDIAGQLVRLFGHPAAWAAWLRGQPANVSVFSASLRLGVDDEGRRGELLALVPWAEAAGAKWLRVFDDVGAGGPWTTAKWAAAGRQFSWWAEQRRAGGWAVDLIVEAHQAWFEPAVFREARERLGFRPALLFDLGHAVRGLGREGALAAWRELAPDCPRVHLKDISPGTGSAGPHCLPGTGLAPLAELITDCRALDQPPVLTLEWERYWAPTLPTLEEALAALRNHFGS